MQFFLNAWVYITGWFGGIFLAAANHPHISSIFIIFALTIQLGLSFKFSPKKSWCDLYLAFYALIIGYVSETYLINIGVIHYITSNTFSIFPPLWIVLLYPLFSSTLNHSFAFINRWIGYPITLGALAPISYLTGYKMGACTFPKGIFTAMICLAIIWIIILPILVSLNRLLLKISFQVDEEFKTQSSIQMLYDNDCPLCSREIQQLKSSPGQENIEFVDISAKNYQSTDHQNLSYQEAMKQLYAIDKNGNILKGTEAFYHVYAKAGWKGLAIAIKAPIFSIFFYYGYKFFARFRLQLTRRNN